MKSFDYCPECDEFAKAGAHGSDCPFSVGLQTSDWRTPPAHYRSEGDLQPWDIIREFGLDFWEGNVIKYVLRARHKGTQTEDLKKARNYLDYLISQSEQ